MSTEADPARPDDSVSEAALLRLHAALGDLDDAIHTARRALDRALGRQPVTDRSRALPLQELNALRDQLEQAGEPAGKGNPRPSIMDIASDPAGTDEDTESDTAGAQVGVAPSGKLRID